MRVRFLVLAKAPVPGRVKTRLCPPCTPTQAAAVAEAALADTLDTVGAVPAAGGVAGRVLVLDGRYPAPPGWDVAPQRGDGLGERLAHAYADTRRDGQASLLVGMDTPQLTVELLTAAAGLLAGPVDAVLGLATDGGWWGLGLREPAHGSALISVPMSTPRTGADTLAALRTAGLRVAMLPTLSDVDTAADAHAVAASCPPRSRFARVVAQFVPQLAIS